MQLPSNMNSSWNEVVWCFIVCARSWIIFITKFFFSKLFIFLEAETSCSFHNEWVFSRTRIFVKQIVTVWATNWKPCSWRFSHWWIVSLRTWGVSFIFCFYFPCHFNSWRLKLFICIRGIISTRSRNIFF